jgi:predicted DNA-binding transcriptional regulator AlpA
MAEICARTTLERTTIYRLERAGKFPKLRKRGDRRVFVLESELVAWMRGDE